MPALILIVIIAVCVYLISREIKRKKLEKEYKELEKNVLYDLGLAGWYSVSYYDKYLTVKSRQTLEKYDAVKYFKEDKNRLYSAETDIKKKNKSREFFQNYLTNNKFKGHPQYIRIEQEIKQLITNTSAYRVNVTYISSAGNALGSKEISLTQNNINKFLKDPSLLMSKSEYNKYLKEQQKEALEQKHHEYYGYVNNIIDYANEKREILLINGSQEQLDTLISRLFDRTINSIKKVKTLDSEEWDIIKSFINQIDEDIKSIVNNNQRILDYYESASFMKLKETCEVLMSTQREFNEYITEKVESVSKLFGTRIVRNETINDDEYQYIRPYKKNYHTIYCGSVFNSFC